MTHRDGERLAEENRRLCDENGALRGRIVELNEEIARLRGELRGLSDEVRRLKDLPKRPEVRPSGLNRKKKGGSGRRTGRRKPRRYSPKARTERVFIEVPDVPEGSVRDGYESYTVQELAVQPVVVEYLRERWRTPDGTRIVAPLPADVNGQYGSGLRRLVVSLYHQGQTTVPRIVTLLNDWGVGISKRTVVRMLTDGVTGLVDEAAQVLSAGIDGADWLHVDDTGARHRNRNGYCTVIGNDRFTGFATGPSKSRLNFLQILGCGDRGHVLNGTAFEYMRSCQLPKITVELLRHGGRQRFDSETEWQAHLDRLGIGARKAVIATEGALWGALSESSTLADTVILSDDAGQFNIGEHALCWVHAERLLQKLIASGPGHRDAVESKRDGIWTLYRQLLDYRTDPDPDTAVSLSRRFDDIFSDTTCYHMLNQLLKRLADNKRELLRVLDHPTTPLHNNLAENDIRAQVTRRRISAGTRSDAGRDARDACLALLKTCRKLNISFWDYLGCRFKVPDAPAIPPLATLVSQRE